MLITCLEATKLNAHGTVSKKDIPFSSIKFLSDADWNRIANTADTHYDNIKSEHPILGELEIIGYGTVQVFDVSVQSDTEAEAERASNIQNAINSINNLNEFCFIHEIPTTTPINIEEIRDIMGLNEPYARMIGTVLTIIDESRPEQQPLLIEETEIIGCVEHDAGVEIELNNNKIIALYKYPHPLENVA